MKQKMIDGLPVADYAFMKATGECHPAETIGRFPEHVHLVRSASDGDIDTLMLGVVTKGTVVRIVRGRKSLGAEGKVIWMKEVMPYGRNYGEPDEVRLGIIVTEGEPPVFVKGEYVAVVKAAEAPVFTCDACGADFPTVEARREHKIIDHPRAPRPNGPSVTEVDGVLETRRGTKVWATCPTHGIVKPALVEWDSWDRDESGKWQPVKRLIAAAERVILPREDGSASTVEFDRTNCGICGEASVLRVIKMRAPRDPEKALKRAKKTAEAVFCGGACLNGKVSCDCFCGGMCHGAANGGLGRALMIEGFSRAIANTTDPAVIADLRARQRELLFPCPGHSRDQVKFFYGEAS